MHSTRLPITGALPAALLAGILIPGCAAIRVTGHGGRAGSLDPAPMEPAGGAEPTPGNVSGGNAPPWDPHRVVIVDGTAGTRVAWETFVDQAARSDVVFFGEIHGHPRVQAVMAEMFPDIVSRAGGTPALSLEFFDRDDQVAVDDYLTGIADEATFEKATGRTPGNYPDGHRKMLETARARGLPVVASNAPRRYARVARTDGFERLASLTDAQRSLFVVPEALTQGDYWTRFARLMENMPGHEQGGTADVEEMARAYFRAQNLWDATMAGAIVQALDRGEAPVVHVVGKFHVEHGGGLVQRVQAAAPNRTLLTVTFVDAGAKTLQEDDRGAADYVFYVGTPNDSATSD